MWINYLKEHFPTFLKELRMHRSTYLLQLPKEIERVMIVETPGNALTMTNKSKRLATA